jgi:hypothetical protein
MKKNFKGRNDPPFLFGYLLLLCIFCSKCEGDHNVAVFESESILKGRIALNLDSIDSYKANNLQPLVINDEDYLAILDVDKYEYIRLNYFKINTGVKSKSYSFDVEGPNSPGVPGNFIFSGESCYVISPVTYQIFEVVDDEIVDVYHLLDGASTIDNQGGLIKSGTRNPCHLYRNHIYCPMDPDAHPYQEDFYNRSLVLGVNRDTGEKEYGFSYPKIYLDYMLPETASYGNTFNDNLMIFSFAILDSVYVYNLDSKKVSTYYAGSVFDFGDPINEDFSAIGRDLQSRMDFNSSIRKYRYIHYDSNKRKYYRFVRHPLKEGSQSEDNNKSIETIIVLDEDFNIEKEILLENNTYSTSSFFSRDSCFYLSRMNSNNVDVDENLWVFSCLDL